MKITKELLKRHGMGLCTTEEKKAVEEWFDQLEGPVMSTRSFQEIEENKKATWNKLSNLVPALESSGGAHKMQPIHLYRKVTRYAAAACIIFVAFFGGRYSVGSAEASPTPEDPAADHLFIFGYKNAKGHLPGKDFKIEFDGSLRLYNNSMASKRINLGDTSFALTSNKNYYLIGDTESPELIIEDHYQISSEKPPAIEGYFSVQRLHE